MPEHAYPTDLSDEQWAIMEPLLPAPKTQGRTGRPRKYPYRQIVNGIFYVLRTGCTWDMMPHDLPPWLTCHHYFSKWRQDDTWQNVHDTLREKLRVQSGRQATPSAAVIDSQTVKTTEKGGQEASNLRQANNQTPVPPLTNNSAKATQPKREGLTNRALLAMMRASVSRDVNDIFSSIPKDYSWE